MTSSWFKKINIQEAIILVHIRTRPFGRISNSIEISLLGRASDVTGVCGLGNPWLYALCGDSPSRVPWDVIRYFESCRLRRKCTFETNNHTNFEKKCLCCCRHCSSPITCCLAPRAWSGARARALRALEASQHVIGLALFLLLAWPRLNITGGELRNDVNGFLTSYAIYSVLPYHLVIVSFLCWYCFFCGWHILFHFELKWWIDCQLSRVTRWHGETSKHTREMFWVKMNLRNFQVRQMLHRFAIL